MTDVSFKIAINSLPRAGRIFLNACGNDMEFCQLQINYLDWTLQNGKDKYDLLKKWNIPVWVMEPVRGGKLAKLDESYETKMKAFRPDESIAAWSFRFLQELSDIKMIFSGMSNMEQLQQNIETYNTEKPLNEQEFAAIMNIADAMIAKNNVPCTACSYCVEHCPVGIAIPEIIKLYNALSEGSTDKPGNPGPSDCIGCGKCRFVCPQGIDVPKVMADYASKL